MGATKLTLQDLLQGAQNDDRAPSVVGSTRSRKAIDNVLLPEDNDTAGETLLHTLFQHLAPVYVTDAAGVLVAYSKSFTELCTTLFGMASRSVDEGTTPPGIMEIIEQLYGEKRDIRRSDTVQVGEETRYFISRHFPIHDDHGDHIGFGGIYEDVTPLARVTRKSSAMESWLQDLIRSSSDWVWAVDRNFNLTFVSPRISELTDEPAQMMIGRHLFDLGEFDIKDRLSGSTKSDISHHSPFRARRFLITKKNGRCHHILLNGVPVFEETSGRFVGYRGTGTDITGQHEAEQLAASARERLQETFEELQKRNEELAIALEHSQVADRAKMDFLAMMSHELKTPLNCIIGFSDAALQCVHGPIDNAYHEYFENIHKAGQHLLAIINDLLDTANIDRQNLTVNIRPERVDELITEAVSLVDLKAASESLDLSALSPETDLMVNADHLRARQIMVNLIGNAVKFTPDKGRVGIDVATRPGKSVDMVAITVWDTGVGIPAEDQARVFDKFYQVERNVLSRGTEGTGLGLSISRHLARLMGGDLALVSIPEQGSRFTFTLPKATLSSDLPQS